MKKLFLTLLAAASLSTTAIADTNHAACSGVAVFASTAAQLRDLGEPETNLLLDIIINDDLPNESKKYYKKAIELIYNDEKLSGLDSETISNVFYMACMQEMNNAKYK